MKLKTVLSKFHKYQFEVTQRYQDQADYTFYLRIVCLLRH